jgi:hypothetical protein
MPVQRIPRYVLLLRELLKCTWPAHPDEHDLKAKVKVKALCLDFSVMCKHTL